MTAAPASTGRLPRAWAALDARSQAGAAFGALALVGFAVRLWLLSSPFGHMNSDEAHTAIQALEVFRGNVWVFVPGNVYGGNAEAWLDAPLAALFGASVVRLKLETTLLWLLAAGFVFAALRHRGLAAALCGATVVWLPGAALVHLSTLAYPGYASGIAASCAAAALAGRVLDREPAPGAAVPAGIGALAGFAVWQHPLYAHFAGLLVLAVAWRLRRRLARGLVPLAGGAAAALAAPVTVNVLNGFPSLTRRFPAPDVPYPTRVRGWVFDLFPRAVGAKWIEHDWLLGWPGRVHAAAATLALLFAGWLVVRRGSALGGLAVVALFTAPLTLTLFPNAAYTLDGRYAAMALAPAALVVGQAVSLLRPGVARWHRLLAVAAIWVLLASAVPLAQRLPHMPRSVDDGRALVQVLDAHGLRAVRADYWIAYRVVVETDEAVAATPIEPVKFPRYERRVRRAEAEGRSALVLHRSQVRPFQDGAPPFDAHTAHRERYRHHRPVEVGRWTAFLPPGTDETNP